MNASTVLRTKSLGVVHLEAVDTKTTATLTVIVHPETIEETVVAGADEVDLAVVVEAEVDTRVIAIRTTRMIIVDDWGLMAEFYAI